MALENKLGDMTREPDDCATHDGYWECACKTRFIWPKSQFLVKYLCPSCLTMESDGRPDARLIEMREPGNWRFEMTTAQIDAVLAEAVQP